MQIETLIDTLLSDNVTEVCSLQTSLAQMMKAYQLRQRSGESIVTLCRRDFLSAASRVGHSDLGVKKLMESLRKLLRKP